MQAADSHSAVCSMCKTKQNYSALLRPMMHRRMGTSTFSAEANVPKPQISNLKKILEEL